MKNVFFLLTICWLTASCSRGYGCPYTSNDQKTERPELAVNFAKEAVPADQPINQKSAMMKMREDENRLLHPGCE